MLPGKKHTPRDVIDMARRRGWLVVLPALVSTLAALIYSSTVPNMYESDMLIAIVPQRVPDAFVRSTVTLRTEERIGAIAAQVTSRTLLEQIITEFDLYPNERRLMPMEDVVQTMRDSIQTPLDAPRRGPRGPEPASSFHVKFKYPDAGIAARVTQKLGSLFVDQNARDRGAVADATNQFLETQLAEARERLEAQERRLETFRKAHGNELPTQMQSNLQAMQSTQLQIQALVESIARDRDRKMMLERLHAEAINEPASVRTASGTADPSNTASTAISAREQLAAARAALARFELRLQPGHPDVVRARRQIAELEPKAAAETAQTSSPELHGATPEVVQRRERLRLMAAEIESLDRQTKFKESEEQRLRGLVAEYQRRVEAVPAVESEWAVLIRDYDTQQAAYRDLLSKSEAAKVSVDLERRQIGEHFRILDPAVVPVKPVDSARGRINALGLALGVLAGLGLALYLELKTAVFRSESDVLEVLSLPVLALVPHVPTTTELQRRKLRIILLSSCAAAAIAGAAYVTWTLKLWTAVL
jgi:polysaccharide chain length determinant protein (PEP-CTERM system associated)